MVVGSSASRGICIKRPKRPKITHDRRDVSQRGEGPRLDSTVWDRRLNGNFGGINLDGVRERILPGINDKAGAMRKICAGFLTSTACGCH